MRACQSLYNLFVPYFDLIKYYNKTRLQNRHKGVENTCDLSYSSIKNIATFHEGVGSSRYKKRKA
jgi:hypothetical protein